MQLKRIILKGFKSFPEKTLLDFDEGVTAIVGPNGSGKSNIIEAIRWVMGEQSAKTLRGTRMDDVIFSGTDRRKAINIAEVELILDNSDNYLDIDYEEVSILRRLSRSSGSTYMINQQECRLKDIVNLFMDSGLGKESFSVISQGEVEAIFNSKPKDRRGIFEEAAGVFKYKVRKEDAEKKLSETKDNLDRVRDILYELESQLEPLKKQADTAKTYLNHKEKLTDLDVALTVHQIKALSEEMDKDKKKQEGIMADLEKVEEKIAHLEKEKKNREMKLETFREKFEAFNERRIETVREKERLEASLNLFDEKTKHREEFIQEKEKLIKELRSRNKKEEKDYGQIEKTYLQEKEALEKVNQEIKKLENRRSYLEGDKGLQMEELRSQYIDDLQKETSLKNESAYLEQELSRNQIEEEKMKKKVMKINRELAKNKENVEEKKLSYQARKEELFSLMKEYQKQEKEFKKSKKQREMISQKRLKHSNELEKSKAKVFSLKEMKENYSGYYAGVRSTMKAKEKLSGIVATVAESITIPKEYLLAINTVLGSSSQFVIVENEKDARDAIKYLKKKKSGRATFLPITTIRPRRISKHQIKKIKEMPGYLGMANELVEKNEKVKNIIDNLLGRTILASTLEDANEIARSIGFSNRVVSLEGDIINAGGSMTGGGRRNHLNPVFSQKAELSQLKEKIEEKEEILSELSKDEEDFRVKEQNLAKELEEIRLAGEKKRLNEQEVKSGLENIQEESYRLNRELKASRFEWEEKKEVIEEYKKDFKEKKESLKEIEDSVRKSNEDMKLLASEQENIDLKREELSLEIEEMREERNDIREKIAREKTRVEHHSAQIAENKKQIEKIKKEIQAFDQGLERSSKEEINASFEACLIKEKELEENQSASRIRIKEITAKNEKAREELKELNDQEQLLKDEKGKLDIRSSKNDVRMDYLLDYLVEEYKISFEEARLEEELSIDLSEAKKEVSLLKKEIDELGPVNLNSINEFEAVNERYQFLSSQQNDLLEAKETLFDTMDEMDLIVEKYFKETFDQVKAEFSEVFPKMFGGGFAELSLTEPDNLLESGIEITAQPPGKQLTRLSLLSGGERALTAISLLFSIIQVNPIPFVILDEAEAALDDANVIRFGKYLRNFEADTQFIVITHRKGTMEHSDQLYGVTMQEKGISKIVGVSLKEAEGIEGVS